MHDRLLCGATESRSVGAFGQFWRLPRAALETSLCPGLSTHGPLALASPPKAKPTWKLFYGLASTTPKASNMKRTYWRRPSPGGLPKKAQPLRAKPLRRRLSPEIRPVAAPGILGQGRPPFRRDRHVFVSGPNGIEMHGAQKWQARADRGKAFAAGAVGPVGSEHERIGSDHLVEKDRITAR